MLLHLPRFIRELKNRKPFHALDGVSFEVRRGECLGIIGRNGSGKSTTLGLIAGVLRPTSGEIIVRGRTAPLLELGAGFHPELSGRENIILNGILLGMTRAQVMDRIEDIIEFSGVREFIHRPIRVYSSGMVARLGFSVAVHLDPEILLIDEVLAVGDEDFQKKCLAKMHEFHSHGVTMVFVSHDLDDIAKICDRVALLEKGHLVEIGETNRVIANYTKEKSRASAEGWEI
jgi:lipopolysaccharide transport system ATP-binding protein